MRSFNRVFLIPFLLAVAVYFVGAGLAILLPTYIDASLVPVAGPDLVSTIIIRICVLYAVMLVLSLVEFNTPLTFKDYFAWRSVKVRSLLIWFIIALVFSVVITSIHHFRNISIFVWGDRQLVTVTPLEAFNFLFVMIIACTFEELLFRGFILSGLKRFINPGTAVLLSTFVWMIPSAQHGLFEVMAVFVFGLLLCMSRLTTRSIIPPIVMHITLILSEVGFVRLFHH